MGRKRVRRVRVGLTQYISQITAQISTNVNEKLMIASIIALIHKEVMSVVVEKVTLEMVRKTEQVALKMNQSL